jgi:hypothetical protein
LKEECTLKKLILDASNLQLPDEICSGK